MEGGGWKTPPPPVLHQLKKPGANRVKNTQQKFVSVPTFVQQFLSFIEKVELLKNDMVLFSETKFASP